MTPNREIENPLTIMGYDPDRSGYLGEWQTAPCGRCGREVDDAAPHECTLDPAAHKGHGCRYDQ